MHSHPHQLHQLMAKLDQALTGKDHAVKDARFMSALDWMLDAEGAWYLSDGGYSRVMVSEGPSPQLYLSSVSTRQVFGRWEAAAKERQAVEDYLAEELSDLMGDMGDMLDV